jgi:GT2 family glycosyltransferase
MLNTMAAESSSPLVSVIIVSWNARKYVHECLESLLQTCSDSNLEIILVDNASADGTPEMVEECFPTVKLIREDRNLGFSKANNIGIRQSTGEYVCLVNSDVRFTNNCIKPMLAFLREHPDVGIMGPKMLTASQQTTRSTMRFPTVWNMFCRSVGLDVLFRQSSIPHSQMMSDFDHETTRDVEILNGWFWMLPRAAVDQVGLLDERFFIYGEDMDWCYRFYKAKKRVVFFADAEAIHHGGASSAAAPLRFEVECLRADGQFYEKHYGLLRRAGLRSIRVVHHMIRATGFGLVSVVWRSGPGEIKQRFQREAAVLEWLLRGSGSSPSV